MPREKTVKLGEEQYKALSGLLKGQRQRAQALEGLIEVLEQAVKEDKYVLFDVLTDPSALQLRPRKKS